MKRILLVFSFMIACTITVYSQTWSAEQQQVIAQVKNCFDKWWAAVKTGDSASFRSACPCDADFAIWSTDFGAPIGIDEASSILKFAKDPSIDHFQTIRPVRVKIVDNIAVMYYYQDTYRGTLSDYSSFSAKRLTVLRKVSGRWQLVADMSDVEIEE